MRATAPAGDASFVGVVSWAGERGYGVRQAEATQAQADASDHEPSNSDASVKH
jgi:hypothetical protein